MREAKVRLEPKFVEFLVWRGEEDIPHVWVLLGRLGHAEGNWRELYGVSLRLLLLLLPLLLLLI